MKDDFLLNPLELHRQQTLTQIRECNEYTKKYGLTLSDADIICFMDSRNSALKGLGRVEFSNEVVKKLIFEFCDSAYIQQDNYLETLQDLLEIFYYFKNESLDEMSDDELLSVMKQYYEAECQGSIDYLQETILEDISRNVRYGKGILRNYGDDDEI
jgi:predicted house-cleaning noncanonical NTP pyrophosphatase (MazG superfamily)